MTTSAHRPRSVAAQDAFAALIREHVAPALRELGFKGSGSAFSLPDPGHWVLIGFQRSVHDDRREVRFTANLSVCSRAAWQAERLVRPHFPERPAANTRYGPTVWQIRIGLALPGGRDTWWTVGPGTDLAVLGRDVVAAFRDYGLPAMREHL